MVYLIWNQMTKPPKLNLHLNNSLVFLKMNFVKIVSKIKKKIDFLRWTRFGANVKLVSVGWVQSNILCDQCWTMCTRKKWVLSGFYSNSPKHSLVWVRIIREMCELDECNCKFWFNKIEWNKYYWLSGWILNTLLQQIKLMLKFIYWFRIFSYRYPFK